MTQQAITRVRATELTDEQLTSRLYQRARCARSRLDPDEWFPVTPEVTKARHQAARALAVCIACPVRAYCLEYSLRHAFDIGAHGIWGGLVENERRSVRRKWLSGTSVTELI